MKLLQAIRSRGINIEEIYNEQVKTPENSVLNESSDENFYC